MAAGDFTITDTSIRQAGNHWRISGTLEVGTTAAQADIFPSGHIIAFNIDHNRDDVDMAVPRVHINASDFGGTADSGSIYVDANVSDTDIVAWTADFLM